MSSIETTVSPNEEGEESVVAAPIFEEVGKSLEIAVPPSASLGYFEGAIKSGIDRLESTKELFNAMGETTFVSRVQEAITALYAILGGVNEIRVENYNERVAFNEQYYAWKEAHSNHGVTLIQETLEEEDVTGDDLDDLFDEDTEGL